MAIINNTVSLEGESLVFSNKLFTTDILTINGYTDDVVGATGSEYFNKFFRYTTDGVVWSEWRVLNESNLQAIVINRKYDFTIEYKYTKTGAGSTVLTWNWTSLNITLNNTPCGVVYKDSFFNTLLDSCNSSNVLNWSVNVLNKLYHPGIVPKALERGSEENINEEDRDYIDLWRSITHFFSMIVNYGRELENLPNNQELLRQYLEGKGIYVRPNETLEDLQFIMKNRLKQVRERGSLLIIEPKKYNDQNQLERVDGELLRILSYDSTVDELMFAVSNNKTCGWNINLHSPLYKGVQNQPGLVKYLASAPDYEPGQTCEQQLYDCFLVNTAEPIEETLPIIAGSEVGYEVDGGFTAIVIEKTTGQKSGIGFTGAPQSKHVKSVDSSLPYEISFLAKVTDVSIKIGVSLFGFDQSGNVANPTSFNTQQSNNVALDKVQLPKANEFYLVRIIVYPFTTSYDSQIAKSSLNEGFNLKFDSKTTGIVPEIVIDDTDSDSSGELSLANLEVKLSRTEYGKGFVAGGQLCEMWVKNNSPQHSDEDVTQIVSKTLIPYKMGSVINFIQ